jgi:hypothetical protein
MSPCQCSDPYLLLELLYGPERGRAAADCLRPLLAESIGSHPAGSKLDESRIFLSLPPGQPALPEQTLAAFSGLHLPSSTSGDAMTVLCRQYDLMLDVELHHNLNDQNADVLLCTVETLLDKLRQGAHLLRLRHIARLWQEAADTDTLHCPQDLLILSFLRAALQLAAPHVCLAAEVEGPLEMRPAYFGNGLNAAHLIETSELPLLLLDAFMRQESVSLQTWVNQLRLPITEISYLHRLAWPDAAAGQLAAGFLEESQHNTLQKTLTAVEEKRPTFLTALEQAAGSLPPKETMRRALAAHAVLLALNGVPVLDANPDTLTGLDELLRARAASPAFSPWGAQMGLPCGDACLGLMRISPSGAMALCFTNLSDKPQTAALDAAALGFSGNLRDLLSGDVMNLNGKDWCKLEGYQSRWWVNAPG